MTQREERAISREETSIGGEAEYIVKKAQEHDSRVVRLPPLVFFSTETGDAWVLDPEDHLALCLVRDGVRQDFTIVDTPTQFQIGWEAQYDIVGEMFAVSTQAGQVKTIVGYPTGEIEDAIGRGPYASDTGHLHL